MPVLQAGKPDTVFPPRWAEYEAVLWAVGWALSVLRVRKPVMVFAPRWAEQGAVGWAELLVVLLRLYEPPGLRAGPSAHPRSAQPETERIGAVS